jgi:hypothetical protein
MILPKTTDTLALQNALTPNVIAIPGNYSCRQSNTCQRQKGGTPYQLPNAVPYTPPCNNTYPPVLITSAAVTFGTWSLSTACNTDSGGSTIFNNFTTFPTTATLTPDSVLGPCVLSARLSGYYDWQGFSDAHCATPYGPSQAGLLTVICDFMGLTIFIAIGNTVPSAFVAPLPANIPVGTPGLSLSNQNTDTDVYGIILPSLSVVFSTT